MADWMPLSWRIAWRFLLENRRAMALSGLGVVFGVGFFICGQAQTEGFQRFYIETILGTSGSVIISDRKERTFVLEETQADGGIQMQKAQRTRFYPGIADAYQIIDLLMQYPQVEAASPVVEGNAHVAFAFRTDTVRVYGIDLGLHLSATDFGKQIVAGSLDDFRFEPASVAVGSLLADKLELSVGDHVHLTGPNGNRRRFVVTCIYETGINMIDGQRVYLHRLAAQRLLNKPFETSHILVKLRDPLRAPALAAAFEDHFSHLSRSWQDRERGNLAIFQTLRLSAGLAVGAIILLAGFSIFNVLTMSVLEKTKEIAILRSMGFQRGNIAAIFVWQGLILAGIGIVLGWAVGALLTFGVSRFPIRIRGFLKADYFIVEWSLSHYIWAALLAIGVVLVAAYLPARRAAHLKPVSVLRGTSH